MMVVPRISMLRIGVAVALFASSAVCGGWKWERLLG
jgi:hypothetical protein